MRSKKYTPADAAEIQELRKTMKLKDIALSKGVDRSIIHKILDEHGEMRGGDQTYIPRVLQEWPEHTSFEADELQVRFG